MNYTVMAYVVMNYTVMAHVVLAAKKFGLYSYGLYSYGPYSDGLYSDGLYTDGLYSYDLHSYGLHLERVCQARRTWITPKCACACVQACMWPHVRGAHAREWAPRTKVLLEVCERQIRRQFAEEVRRPHNHILFRIDALHPVGIARDPSMRMCVRAWVGMHA